MALHGIQCPFCDADVPSDAALVEERIGEFSMAPPATAEVIGKPRVARRVALPKRRTTEPERPGPGAVPDAEAPGERGTASRTRRPPVAPRHIDKLAWEGATRPEAGPSPDVTEFLERDPAAAGGVRLKRVERRRKEPGWLVGARRVAAYGGIAVLAVIAALIALSLFGMGSLVGEGVASTESTAPGVFRPAASRSGILLGDEVDRAAEVVRRCFSAESLGAMLPHVRRAETVEPLMHDWYMRHPFGNFRPGKVIRSKKIEVNDGMEIIVLSMAMEQGEGPKYYHVEQRGDGEMRVDWEVTVGYRAMPWEHFRDRRPVEPVPFRLRARLSDYYNYEFSDSAKWQAIELYYPGDDEFRLTGYVDRESPHGLRLATRLEFAPRNLVLALRYPANAKTSELVEIARVENDSWYRK